jgi:hypothetical protein
MADHLKEPFLTGRQAGEYLRITSRERDLLIETGQLPAVKRGGD